MGFSLPELDPAVPKPPAHFLRPRKSSRCNTKCFGCDHNCLVADRHCETEPVALTPPLKPPAHQRASLKFRLRVIKGDSAALKYEVIKPSSSVNEAAKPVPEIPAIPAIPAVPAIPAIPAVPAITARAEKEQGPEFTLSLSKNEIEEDFIAMTGAKPPRRPKKRPKRVREQLDDLFPGVHLSKRVTEEQYNVSGSDLK